MQAGINCQHSAGINMEHCIILAQAHTRPRDGGFAATTFNCIDIHPGTTCKQIDIGTRDTGDRAAIHIDNGTSQSLVTRGGNVEYGSALLLITQIEN